jgi:hypothetical protein
MPTPAPSSPLSPANTPDWRVFRYTDKTCQHHKTVCFPATGNVAFTWSPDWACSSCRPRAEAMVGWAMEPILAGGRVAVAVLDKGEDDYRNDSEERWHRRVGWRVHHMSHATEPRALVVVEHGRTLFLATEQLGGQRAEPRDDRWRHLPADEAADILADALAGDPVRVEAFYFRGFGDWIVEIGRDRWAILMAVEGLEVTRPGFSMVKAATTTQPGGLLLL